MDPASRWFKSSAPATQEAERDRQSRADVRREQILIAIKNNSLPKPIEKRLHDCRDGKVPWIATLTPAELLIVRSHGIRPIAAISASCWLHYGWSWTNGHREGWQAALRRLREEAKAAGANAVLDVKMRTIPLQHDKSMDFTLVGTAVHVEGWPDREAIISTVPTLEFVKLLDMGIVPTGIAIGAQYNWLYGGPGDLSQIGNTEVSSLSNFWSNVRSGALQQLRADSRQQGNGCLAHIHFSQMFKCEGNSYLARYIVIATVIQRAGTNEVTDDIRMCVNMGRKSLSAPSSHHQSYETTDQEGAI